MMIITHS